MNRFCWLGISLFLLFACDQQSKTNVDEVGSTLQQYLNFDSVEGFADVVPGRQWSFPKDHGSHPAFRTEWWYYTGHFKTDDKREYGFQVTLFRFKVGQQGKAESAWAANHIYMGHVALTDVAANQYYHEQRLQRAALSLAGAQTEPFRVWLDDWQISGSGEAPVVNVTVADKVLSLQLQSEKPIVFQGEQGYSQKGDQPEQASYYYSIPRMSLQGTLKESQGLQKIRGSAWFDREWSSRALADHVRGWDWFSLQLSDGQELMYYQLRDQSHQAITQSHGVLINPQGGTTPIKATDMTLTPLRYWTSTNSARQYPIEWRLQVAALGIDLQVTSRVDAQEFLGLVTYWEGLVDAKGEVQNRTVTGQGYLELTGYGTDVE